MPQNPLKSQRTPAARHTIYITTSNKDTPPHPVPALARPVELTPAQRKQRIQSTFDTVASGYDGEALWFFPASAAGAVDYFQLHGHEHVLDVATGTGWAALTLVHALPNGRVTGIDLSGGMLDQARAKAHARGLHNTEFLEMDVDALNFPPQHFHAANCAFGIFFLEDMTRALRSISRCVKPGGTVVITSFAAGAFLPHSDVFLDRIERHGIPRPPLSYVRTDTEDKTRALFHAAGLTQVQTHRRDLSRDVDAEGWWQLVWNAGYRGIVNQLGADKIDAFRTAHLAEIQSLVGAGNAQLCVEVIDTVGRVK